MHEPDGEALNFANYTDVYWYRVTKYGENHKEREYNYSVRNFEKYLNEHPSSVDVIVDSTHTRASIISNKQDQYKLTKQILTSINTTINPGSIVEWNDGHWIVYQKEVNPNQAYNSCYMVECNKKLKWIDEYGVEQEEWAYIFSSKDSIVKQNFRTWNRLITPQPNQWLEMLVPAKKTIKMDQKFIIDGRAWFVDEYDATSSKGVTYYSLTEDKIDRMDDSIENGLANANKLDCYKIVIQDEISCGLNDNYIISPTVYNDGVIDIQPLGYIIEDRDVASLMLLNNNATIVPISKGQTTLKIYLINQPKVFKSIVINITDMTEQSAVLIGDDSIKTTDFAIYSVYRISDSKIIDPIISFSISDSNLASGILLDDGTLKIIANEDNKLGVVTVIINTSSNTYTKKIAIRSLW